MNYYVNILRILERIVKQMVFCFNNENELMFIFVLLKKNNTDSLVTDTISKLVSGLPKGRNVYNILLRSKVSGKKLRS